MKHSLFTVSFAGLWGQHRLTLEEAIDRTADLGYTGIEIMAKRPHLSPLDYSLKDCERLRKQIEKRGLTVAALAAYTNFTGGLESAEVPWNEFQASYIEALAERAAILGGEKLIRVFSSYERDDMSYFAQWQRTVDGLRECCDRAARHGVTIGLQNHHDLGAATKTLMELVRQIDRANLIPMLDCWAVHLRGESMAESVKAAVTTMRFTTVADYVVLPRTRYIGEFVNYVEQTPPAALAVPMGEGDLDYATFFSALEKGGFDGWVSYEMCSPVRGGGALTNLEHYARSFLDYMNRRNGRHRAGSKRGK